ncbi:MAG: hypothetical protein ACK5JJ_07330 [Cyanobacteriota bacterium]|jgi:hypothetical protein
MTTMQVAYYAFPDRATWLTQGKTAGLLNAAGEPTIPDGAALYELGQIEVCDPTGNVITPITYLPGHHVNLLHPDPPAILDPYLRIVSSARSYFLGWPAQCPDDAILNAIAALS